VGNVLLAVVVVLTTAFLLAVVAGALLIRRGIRAARARAVTLQPRVTELRAWLVPPGPRRDAARLRAELAAEVQATRSLLAEAPQGLVFRADAQVLLRDIEQTAAALDHELRHIEGFRDPYRQQAALDAVRPQVQQLIDTGYTARETVLRTAAADRERRLGSLQNDVAHQAAALRRYQHARDAEVR
jgi:hypothetical protein